MSKNRIPTRSPSKRAVLGWLGLGLALCLLLWPARSGSTQGEAALVHPQPGVFNIGQGQVETLDIWLEKAQDVYGIDVRLTFDPAVVEVVDADADQDGIQMLPGVFPRPNFLMRNEADNQAGTLQYACTQVNPAAPVFGSGVVFSIQWRGKALGRQSPLGIAFVEIANRQGVKLSVRGLSGTLVVVEAQAPTATPTLPIPGMGPTPTATVEGDARLTGRTYDALQGQPISGARITLEICVPRTFSTHSWSDGTYGLWVPALYLNGCSEVTLRASAEGYQEWSQVVSVESLRADPVRDFALVRGSDPTPTLTPTPQVTPTLAHWTCLPLCFKSYTR